MFGPPQTAWVGFAVATLIAAAVGAADILNRYKESPWRALSTWESAAFVLANGVFGCLAYLAALGFGIVTIKSAPDNPWGEPLKAGFGVGLGAIVVLRGLAFKFAVGEGANEASPATIVDALLAAIDQSIGHKVAKKKDEQVRAIMAAVSYKKARLFLPQYLLSLLEPNAEFEQRNADLARRVSQVIESIDQTEANLEISDGERAHLLGSILVTTFGEDVVRSAVRGFKTELAPEP